MKNLAFTKNVVIAACLLGLIGLAAVSFRPGTQMSTNQNGGYYNQNYGWGGGDD